MGNLIKVCRMRWEIYVIHAVLAIITGMVWFIFHYTKEFFSMYQSVAQVLNALQLLCIVLIIGLVVIVWLQHQKAGVFAFYENGVLNQKTNVFYFYHDIMTYSFIPQSNKSANQLYFETDDDKEETLSALLDKDAFRLFQEGHARIWAKFVVKQIEAKRIVSFDVDEDVTSFKMKVHGNDDDKTLILSHEGIVCYNQFYQWHQLSRYEFSYSGMLTIKDTALQTVFMEPIVNIERFYLFIHVLDHYIKRDYEQAIN
ncbi:hypothetical protein KG089_06070 [Carnobacteriaceae bacterium zg-ZUI252]|nr:hypothetical protein [Carnobacteriaceae bacterium zg-ZUI252]